MKTLTTSTARLTYEHDIMLVDVLNDVQFDKDSMHDLLEAAVGLSEKKKYYAIIDLRKSGQSTPESRKYYSESEHVQYRYADALVVDSLPMRLLVNFFIRINKPKIPTRMFNDPQKAREWIDELIRSKK